ncbi:alpha/beta hydrolase family protein [Pseudomonas sp.]|uniref:alpha/beta hydrolase family protein n=1 Tax=Pseudomonas sp. TaxID=306 RepID=UPI003D6DC1B3
MTIHSESIEIHVDGETIAATIVSPGDKVPGILFVHGWGGSQQRDLARAKHITGLGCVCMTFDLRGHEKTESQRLSVTREQNLADLLAAYDRLVSHPAVDTSAIALIGSSYGGYLATLLTALRPVKWLALRVPALYWDDEWAMPKQGLDRQRLTDYRRRCAAGRVGAGRLCPAQHPDELPFGFRQRPFTDPSNRRRRRSCAIQRPQPESLQLDPQRLDQRDGHRRPP